MPLSRIMSLFRRDSSERPYKGSITFEALPEHILYTIFKMISVQDRLAVWLAVRPRTRPTLNYILYDIHACHLSAIIYLTPKGQLLRDCSRAEAHRRMKAIGQLISDKNQIVFLKIVFKSKSLDINSFWCHGRPFPHIKYLHLHDKGARKGKCKATCARLATVPNASLVPNLHKLEMTNIPLDATTQLLLAKLSDDIAIVVLNHYQLTRTELAFIPDSVTIVQLIHLFESNVQAIVDMIQQRDHLKSIEVLTTNEFFEKMFQYSLNYTLTVLGAKIKPYMGSMGEVRCRLNRSTAASVHYNRYLVERVNVMTLEKFEDRPDQLSEQAPEAQMIWNIWVDQESITLNQTRRNFIMDCITIAN